MYILNKINKIKKKGFIKLKNIFRTYKLSVIIFFEIKIKMFNNKQFL